jgi:hypothetical protein
MVYFGISGVVIIICFILFLKVVLKHPLIAQKLEAKRKQEDGTR